ncbi:MAG: outer membrane lipoprotein-sorting protein [Chitinispirillia bacterium]|nr:outer membrane lipoprotein-sorting protein [Chitinispirillia bacterium]
MNKKFVSVMMVVMTAAFTSVNAQNKTPTAEELLAKVDNNEVYKTAEYDGELIIDHNNRKFVKTMKAWVRDNSDSFIEFLNPEDKGTKYLKKGGRLYVYSPDNEGVMLISGHMLKESMMGSDMSYEDAVNNETLASRYNAVVGGTEKWRERDAWVLDLSAKKKTESYPKRKLWIDKENGDLLHYELYALSGAKLKEYNLIKAEVINGKRFPVEVEMKDLLRKNSKTTMKMNNVILDKPIPDAVFSQRNLER